MHGLSALTAAGRQKVCALAAQWRRERWPIVCLQETWLCPISQTAVEQALHSAAAGAFRAPYTAFWAHCARRAPVGAGAADGGEDHASPAPAPSPLASPMDDPSPAPLQPSRPGPPHGQGVGRRRTTGGVGILIDSGLLASGVVRLLGEPERHASGRIISVRLAWEGHTFTLCCVYLLRMGLCTCWKRDEKTVAEKTDAAVRLAGIQRGLCT